MINRIKALFEAPVGGSVESHSVDEIQLAAAALLVEAACLDESYDEVERETVRQALTKEFKLSEEECETLILQAEAAQQQKPAASAAEPVAEEPPVPNEEQQEEVQMSEGEKEEGKGESENERVGPRAGTPE